jgi:hypothetical protein
MKNDARFCVLAIVMSVGAMAHAQPAMEKPDYVVGDKWQYAWSDGDGQTGRRAWEIVEISPEGRLLIKYGSGKTDTFDGAMNFIPDASDPRPERTLKLVAYPLKVGDEWTFKREFAGPNSAETITGKVVAYEPVTVPAGTYNCYRNEASSSQTNKQNKLNRKWIRWYCPEVKGYAKMILETQTYTPYNPASNTTKVETFELTKFTAGK